MARYIYEGVDASGDAMQEFQFAEVLIDCHLLFPLLDENTSVAEKNLARFLLATTVSIIPFLGVHLHHQECMLIRAGGA